MRAVGLLRELGYTNLRHYAGGMADWAQHGGEIERSTVAPGSEAPSPARSRGAAVTGAAGVFLLRALDALAARSVSTLAGLWCLMVVGFGAAYFAVGAATGAALSAGGTPVGADASGLWTALYFSLVTATSVG